MVVIPPPPPKEKVDKVYTVTTRKCKYCNHHEVGIMDEHGNYNILLLGTKIKIVEKDKTKG